MIPPIEKSRLRPWLVFLVVGVLEVAAVATYFMGVRLRLQNSLQTAQRALDQDHLEEAQQHLDLCLQLKPDDPTILLLAARTARRRDDLEQAERHLAALERRPGDPLERVLERRLLSAQYGDLESTESTLWSLTEADNPHASLVLEAMTKGFLERSRSADAARSVILLLQRRPESPCAHLLRGKVWESLEQSPEVEEGALAEYRRALQLNPQLAAARSCLARRLHRAGHAWEAAAHFECVLQQSHPVAPTVLLDWHAVAAT